MKLILPKKLRRLFWWADFSDINSDINIETLKKRITIQTINYGRWEDWLWIIKKFGKKEVKEIIVEIPKSEFRPPALKLICLLLGIKRLKYVSRSDYIKAKKNIR